MCCCADDVEKNVLSRILEKAKPEDMSTSLGG
jgi:hypothetical protein